MCLQKHDTFISHIRSFIIWFQVQIPHPIIGNVLSKEYIFQKYLNIIIKMNVYYSLQIVSY